VDTVKEHIIKYKELSLENISKDEKELIQHAINSASKAYAPYSNFKVGAAVRLQNGIIIEGNNQENAAYPSGLCAERVALFFANANFPDLPVTEIAITVLDQLGNVSKDVITPCGSCRQVIAETEFRFGNNIKIILASKDKVLIFTSIKDLLPFHFVLKK
jgi:cytidine deaminase